jgi:hypothetical protein
MLDKLHLTSPDTDLTKEKVTTLLQGHYQYCSISATKFHNTLLVFHGREKKDHIVSVHLDPRVGNVSPLRIELNPTRFSNANELVQFIEALCEPSDLKIVRVDHAVDLIGVSVEELHSKLILSRKKSREVYRDSRVLTGLHLGRPPELISIYDKGKQEGLGAGIKSRIEVQHYRDKVGVKAFKNLASFQSESPFSKLVFKELVTPQNDSASDRKKLNRLQQEISERGAQASFKRLNINSNFNRDYSHLLVPSPSVPNLDAIYQNNLKEFFNESRMERIRPNE